MANGSRIAKQIISAIGKGFVTFFRALGRGIARSYRNYQIQKRIEDEQRAHYAQIERENYYAGRGFERARADVRAQERLRREDERAFRQMGKNFEKAFAVPTPNNNAFFGETRGRKKKKRSNTYYF